MATLTRTKASKLVDSVVHLLSPYEELYISEIEFSLHYRLEFRTNVMIHRWHTNKNLFRKHAVCQASQLSDLPSRGFVEHFITVARESCKRLLDRGDYTEEILVHGEFQEVKRHYNRYVFLDMKNGVLVGEVHEVKT